MPASPVSKRSRARRGGFTIVELLVSITILTLLVVMLAGVFSQVSRAWTTGEGNIERRRSARALTDYIGAELQSAVLPAEGAAQPGKPNLQFVINPPAAQVPDELRNADTIFWQAPLATETSFGEIAEIGYFVRWVEPDDAAKLKGIDVPRPALCRFFVNPSIPDTANPSPPGSPPNPTPEPAVLPNKDFLIYGGSNPNAWLSPSLLDKLAPAKAPTYAGLFGENVLGLWIQAYGLGVTKDGPQKLGRSFYSLPKTANDPNVGYLYDRPYLDLAGKQVTRSERCYLPARVRISIVQVDSHHVQRLDPVWKEVQTLTREAAILDAAQFMDRFRDAAVANPALAALLPGLRTYTTEVQLENAR